LESLSTRRSNFVFRYRSPEHFLDIFRAYYGPTHKAFGALDAAGQTALHDDFMGLLAQLNHATDGTLVVPSEYLRARASSVWATRTAGPMKATPTPRFG